MSKYVPINKKDKYVPAKPAETKSEYIPANLSKIKASNPEYIPVYLSKMKEAKYVPYSEIVAAKQMAKTNIAGTAQANIGGGEFTAAERIRLKECLKTALANVNYAKFSDFDGSYGSPQNRVIVINVPHASEADFKGNFFNLCDEVLLEDPVVFHSFYTRIYQKQYRPNALASLHRLPNPSDVQSLQLHQVQKGNPDWYLGFSRDSYIEMETSGVNDKTINKFTFRFGKDGSVSIRKIINQRSQPEPIFFSRFISFTENEDEPPKPNELSSINLNLLGNTTWHLLAGSNKGQSKKTSDGLIIVYDSDKWEGKNVIRKIPKLNTDKTGTVETRMCFYDNSLFDNIELNVKAQDNFNLVNLKIILNGVTILDNFSSSFSTNDDKTFNLSDKINNYRKASLLYNHTPNTEGLDAPDYIPTLIITNPILRHAAGELGKAWGREYGPWYKLSNGEWDTGPQNWCGRFNCWGVWEAMRRDEISYNLYKPKNQYPYLFPYPADTCMPFKEWFKPADLMYLPIYEPPLIINRKLKARTAYAELGDLIKPGYAVNFKGHGAFFLYWVEHKQPGNLNPDIIYSSSRIHNEDSDIERENFEQILDSKPKDSYKPGRFRPDYAINWFAHISGCSGGTVRIGVGAVICMSKWNQDYVNDLNINRHGEVVPWANDFDLNNPDPDIQIKNKENAINVINGFARTDGNVLFA